jgi:rhodanese-related sulfurtransferase
VVNTGESDAQEIVRAAADAWLNSEDSTPIVSADSVFENLSDGDDSNNPFIVSVRAPDAYALGHVAGAINIPWSQIASPENLAKLPADQSILAYCYTGHTGQVATTVLGILGYNVSNMKYGMMGWTQDDEVLATARYDPATSPDYPLEGTAATAAAEETAVEEATPAELPDTGGMPIPVEGLVMGFGALTAAAGLYLRRRKAA